MFPYLRYRGHHLTAGVNILHQPQPPAPSCEALLNQTKTLSKYYQGLEITGYVYDGVYNAIMAEGEHEK